jgi:hypothetical protein
VVPGLGIEPRFTASKAAVLPLDDPGVYGMNLLVGRITENYGFIKS